MLDTSDSDTAPQQGGGKDDCEQVAIPSGRYLTGIRLILVCTRLVVLSDLPSSVQIPSSPTAICWHTAYAFAFSSRRPRSLSSAPPWSPSRPT